MVNMIPGPIGVCGPMMVIEPMADPRWYKTYEIQQQIDEVPCDPSNCPDFARGFVAQFDISTDLGMAQAKYVRGDRSRSHTEERISQTMVRFTFPPGTRCFAPPEGPRHTRPRDGEQVLIERGGDWRGNPHGLYVQHTRAEFFLESWAENQAGLADIARRG